MAALQRISAWVPKPSFKTTTPKWTWGDAGTPFGAPVNPLT